MDPKTSDWRPGPTVCRCCLAEGCYKDISTEYFWMGKREVYSEMLSDNLNISIAYSQSGGPNSNSRLICEPCISRLRDASDFRRQVLECEKTFMQHLDPGSTSVQKELQLTLDDVKVERVKLEKKISDDEDFDDRVDFIVDDDDDDDLDDEPLMKLATKIPKKELDLLEILDSSQITVKRKATSKAKVPPAKKTKKREIVIKPSASKPSASATKTTEKKKKGPVTPSKKWSPARKFNDERHNAAIILESSNICPFKWNRSAFVCSYCTHTSADFRPIREHVREHANRIEALRLARGYTIKADITNLKCELCLQNIKDIPTLVDHLIEVHDKPLEKKYGPGIMPFLLTGDAFKCAICDLSFDLFTNLNKHLNEHYANSVCPLCGKSFSELPRLKAHLLMHEKGTKLRCTCTKCGEIFTNLSDKNKHMVSKHGVLKHKCPYCNDSFKSYNDRMKHMKKYHNKKIEYRCNRCPAVFLLRSQRTIHIRDVHNKNERFACTVCSFRFVRSCQLKNHMIKHSLERKRKNKVQKKSYVKTRRSGHAA